MGKGVQKNVLCWEVVPILGGSFIEDSTVFSSSIYLSSLPEPWQDIRGGSFNCTDCLETLPCQNHYLTFGANDLNISSRRSRIVLTRPLPVQNLQVVSYPSLPLPLILPTRVGTRETHAPLINVCVLVRNCPN